jgi:hypothetical protein
MLAAQFYSWRRVVARAGIVDPMVLVIASGMARDQAILAPVGGGAGRLIGVLACAGVGKALTARGTAGSSDRAAIGWRYQRAIPGPPRPNNHSATTLNSPNGPLENEDHPRRRRH